MFRCNRTVISPTQAGEPLVYKIRATEKPTESSVIDLRTPRPPIPRRSIFIQEKKLMKNILITCCVLLGVAIFPMPYGFYQFLRLAVCGSMVYYIIQEYSKNYKINTVACIITLLYNPVFPVHLNKDIWQMLNVLTAIYLYYLVCNIRDTK